MQGFTGPTAHRLAFSMLLMSTYRTSKVHSLPDQVPIVLNEQSLGSPEVFFYFARGPFPLLFETKHRDPSPTVDYVAASCRRGIFDVWEPRTNTSTGRIHPRRVDDFRSSTCSVACRACWARLCSRTCFLLNIHRHFGFPRIFLGWKCRRCGEFRVSSSRSNPRMTIQGYGSMLG